MERDGEGDRMKGLQGSKWTLLFVRSLKPLLLVRRQKQLQWRSASLDGNVDNPSEDGKEDEDADANGDTDNGDGLWSCEFVVPTIVITEP